MFNSLRLRKKITTIFTLVAMVFNMAQPALLALTFATPARAQDNSASSTPAQFNFVYNASTHNFDLTVPTTGKVTYGLYYQTPTKLDAVMGGGDATNNIYSTSIYAGTESSGTGVPETVVRGILKTQTDKSTANYFVMDGTTLRTVAEVPVSSSELSESEQAWLADPATYGDLTPGVAYHAPFNQNVSVNFTSLPENSGTITFHQVDLTPEQVKASGAVSATGYEITSDMADGTFSYTLTLPNPSAKTDVGVQYSEDGQTFNPTTNVTSEQSKITISDLNHFTIFVVTNLQPAYAAPGSGGVYSAYYGPGNGHIAVSPGATAVFAGRQAGIIKAGQGTDPGQGTGPLFLDGWDEGLFAFKPTVTIDAFAVSPVTYDVQNQFGVNPVWMTIEIDTGTLLDRADNTTYQFVPTSNPAGWNTFNAGSGLWLQWTTYLSGVTVGSPMTLSAIAAAHTGLNVVRAYLRLGMGSSYYNGGTGTTAWVDQATFGGETYDFSVACSDNILDVPSEFNTIQDAIANATASCSTIRVAAGTYTEVGQIVIDKNLSIVGADKATTIIKPAQDTGDTNSGDGRGWFLTSPGITFNMSGVTLDGVGKNICFGIYDYSLGTIQDINVKNISCAQYYGRAIYLKNNATISNVRFENIGRIGVFIWQGATSAIVDGITYIGKGVGDFLDYGIELGNGAIATLSNNTISGNRGVASDGSKSAGILVTTYFGPGTTATITGNSLTDNTDGIAVGFDGSDTSVVTAHNNNLSGNIEHGVISTAPSVNATSNWWGNASGPLDNKTLPGTPNYNNLSGTGNSVTSYVDYKPWYTNAGMTTFSSAKTITAFSFTSPAVTGVINEGAKTIALIVPHSTVLTALVPTITLSAGASVSPLSGVAHDFTTPQTYTVTAADASIADYTVTVQKNPYLFLNVVVINNDGGTAADTAWSPMAISSPWATLNSPPFGVGQAESGDFLPTGTYELSEVANPGPEPAGYTASAWSCVKNGAPAVDGSSVTLGMGDSATCTITNNDSDIFPPAAFTVGLVTPSGGTLSPGYWNSTNTAVDVRVPFANDSSLTGGAMQLQVDAGGGFVNVRSPIVIDSGWLNTTHLLFAISAAQLEGIAGFSDGDSVTFRAIITDLAGNPTTGTQSATTLTVDQTVPTVASVDSDGQTYNISTVSPHTIKVTFSEDIAIVPDVSVSGGAQTVTNCGDADAKTFCFAYSVPPTQDTEKIVQILNARDIAGNTMVNDFSHTFAVDTIVPAAFTVGAVNTTSVQPPDIASYWNGADIGAHILVPFANDTSLTGGTMQLQSNVGGDYISFGSAYEIFPWYLNSSSLFGVGSLEGIAGFSEGVSVNFRAIITDKAGNPTIGTPSLTTLTVDQTAPTVTNVTSSHANGTFTVGEVIPINVTFSEIVNVIGTPDIYLLTSPFGTGQLLYSSGTGTDTLTFNYTVTIGDSSADLDYFATDSLGFRGGTINDAAGNSAILTLPTPGAAGSLGANKNIVIVSPATLTVVKTGDFQGLELGDSRRTPTFEFLVTGIGETVFSHGYDLTPDADEGDETETSAPISLVPGTYDVLEALRDGWQLTGVECIYDGESTGVAVAQGERITVESGDEVTCTFTNTTRTIVSGMKWNDVNSDRQSLGESGIAGWTINLFNATLLDTPDGQIFTATTLEASTTTDVNGNYSFANLDPERDYVVCEETQSGWNQTSSISASDGTVICANGTVGYIAINTGGGQPINFTNMNFGNHYTPTPPPGGDGSGGGGGDVLSAATAPVCNDTKPGTPTLLSATPGLNSVLLRWAEGSGPLTYYLVAYGLTSGSLTYGNPNIGGSGTTSYTINNLSGGTRYYFQIRSGNGCATGEFGNILSATPTGGRVTTLATGFEPGVLGAETTADSPTISPTPSPSTENVTAGDILGSEKSAQKSFDWRWLWLLVIPAGIILVLYRRRSN